jgi:hypothetical protein
MAPVESMESAYHSAYHRAQRSWGWATNDVTEQGGMLLIYTEKRPPHREAG